MKRTYAFTLILASIFIFSCKKSSQNDCASDHTGSILIHNDGSFMPVGTADFYRGSVKLASVAKGQSATVDNIPAGAFIMTVKMGADTIYDDTFDPDTIVQCQTLHYYTSEKYIPISDRRLKKNITPIIDVLANISALNIYSFEYNAPKGYTGFLPAGKHFGFMAQELKDTYPTFVKKNNTGYYSVDYHEMIPLLAQGIKEQQQEINDLKKEVAELKSMIRNQQPVALK